MIINQALLWVILGVCIFLFYLGFFYRVSIWLQGGDAGEGKKGSKICRFFRYSGLFLKTLFSRRAGQMVKSFVSDGIIHKNLFKDSILKWIIHIFIFWGLVSFALITLLHMIAIAAAPDNSSIGAASPWFVMVFGTIENRFTAIIIDLSKIAILGAAFIAVLRVLFLKKKYKSVELKDKSAGVMISMIALLSFFYEGTFFLSMETPVSRAAFAPGGYILSLILGFIPGINWGLAAAVFFYAYIILLFLFIAFIPFGKYSHMVFGPIVVVYNKMKEKKH